MRTINFKEAQFNFPPSKIAKLKKLKTENQVIGQERAVQAIKMGLGLSAPGFNLFVMGASGTGRRSTVIEMLKDYKPNYTELTDIAYVYNFKKPLEPDALVFPGGEGNNFKTVLRQTISDIVAGATDLLRSESYTAKSNRIINDGSAVETGLLLNFETVMQGMGFKLVQEKRENAPASYDLNPIVDGVETTLAEVRNKLESKEITKKAYDAIMDDYYKCIEIMNDLFDAIRDNQVEVQKQMEKLLHDSIKPIIDEKFKPLFDTVQGYEKKYSGNGKEHAKKILTFLKNIQTNLDEQVHIFVQGFKHASTKKHFLAKYDINLVCENSKDKDYVITENLPTFANLFGSIENTALNAPPVRDAHMRIAPGAVHRAQGGYLILRLQDLVTEEDSYFYLKRVLQSQQIEIQAAATSNTATSIFKPVPIQANFKVILIGDSNTYDSMYQQDPDFSKLFKICAEFSPIMPRTDENEAAFVSFVDKIAARNHTVKIANSGCARLLAYACELSGSRKFISTQFAKISDTILQASFIAKQKNAPSIDDKIITDTICEMRFLSSLPEQEYLDELKNGIVFLSVQGKKVGSINGLAVQDRGYFSFGVPEVITAQCSPGELGVVNIESEVGFSGEVYDKAHLIISSLLKNTYARDIKLSVDASICFEQSYGMIEGDSASCAEFLALLSSISEIPLRQDLAITGSLNQHGEVQPIGGVSEKITGFFKACKIVGFTGTQGVVIPESNTQDLFLDDEILAAVKDGSFKIYAVKTIDEAVKLFTECSHAEIVKAVKARLEHFNGVMRKLVSVKRESGRK